MAAQANGAFAQARPCKVVGESARERETFKYYSTLRSTGILNNQTGNPPSSAELTSCSGPILTALAQAGANQTGTHRSLISLFDADHQYIIAEATPTSRLVASAKSTEAEAIWLCGTAIPRAHGVCELSLLGGTLEESQANNEGGSSELPLTISDDLVADPRFNSKPYCQPGTLCRFYAAVPIRTRRGINIGVYCVINETPGVQWNDDYTQRLRDISRNIMSHLESKRLEVLYRRSVRMSRGLGSFIEGEATLVGLSEHAPDVVAPEEVELEGVLNAKQQALVQDDDVDNEVPDTTPTAVDLCQIQASDEPQPLGTKLGSADSFRIPRESPKPTDDNSSSSDESNPATVLSKAANLLRESMEVEGCVFVDATMEAYRAPAQASHANGPLDQPASSSSDDSPYQSATGQPLRPSSVLGFSTSVKSSINGDSPGLLSTSIPEKFLAKLLRRYPQGKIFNFGADGSLQTSDSSDDDRAGRVSSKDMAQSSSLDGKDGLSKSLPGKLPSKPWARQREGTLLAKAFPGARCVAFTPVWDPRKDRWYAGGFIYTNATIRNFTEVDELNYLRAFSILTMAEILRNMDLQADKAKSDVLGSLSHELRSPLHGVILSAELLGETQLSVFQGNAAHTIEVCSRTLLDTIDHLLDYSKINSFSRHRSQANAKKAKLKGVSHSVAALDDESQHGEKYLACNSHLDGLVEEVIESVFAGYTFQFLSLTQPAQKPAKPVTPKRRHRGGSISIRTVAELEPVPTESAKVSKEFGDLSVMLHIDPRQNWSYFVQVGAIRRIVMNIFGNALKYTSKGTIKVLLTQEVIATPHRKKERVVRFTVEDTGKGMSADFLRHGLFRPFSQEDTLSPGTGLGLSLVKRIVAELRGDVQIKSQIGVGTTVSVVLPLQQVPKAPEQALVGTDINRTFLDQLKDLRGLRVGVVLSEKNGQGNLSDWHNAVYNICNDWLSMEVVSNVSGANAADLMIWPHEELPHSSTELRALANRPNVVLCQNAVVAYNHSSAFDAADHSGIFEFISQPIGPRKLARALLLAYTRWMNICDSPTRPPATPLSLKRPEVSPKSHALSLESTPKRPVLGRDLSSQSTATPSDDESVFSDSRTGQITDATPIDESPNSEAPDPFNKFLLVDDNHINLKVLSTYMKKLGIEYDTAMNGQEAVDLFCQPGQGYSCILMDISMPVMDGFEATRCIRAHEGQDNRQRVPIIALSGLASEDAHKEAIGSGMDLLLTKPVKLKTLGNLLESRSIIGGDGQ